MKTFFTSILTIKILFFLVSLTSDAAAQSAQDKKETPFYSDFYVMQVRPMQFKLTYHYPVRDRVLVRILDSRNNVLFVEKALVYKKYEKFFDLAAFNDGRYTFELYDGDERLHQVFDVVTRTTRVVTSQGNDAIVVAGF